MPRKKSDPKKVHRNAVAVRFTDEQIEAIEAKASKEKTTISPWIRDAAVEKAKGKKI
jgi:uncharacterized protein (DUF1778 family)